MCGIFCYILKEILNFEKEIELLNQIYDENISFLKRRGPDLHHCQRLNLNKFEIFLAGTVLWLQGPKPTQQPLTLNDCSLLFNGDIYEFEFLTEDLREKQGDTLALFKILNEVNEKYIFNTLSEIKGPYSLIYIRNNKIYFCRDHYGRRSFLIGRYKNALILTSVAKLNSEIKYLELPPVGLFCYDFNTDNISLTPWNNTTNDILLTHIENLNLNLNIKISLIGNVIDSPICFELNKNCENINFLDNIHFFQNLLEISEWKERIMCIDEFLTKSVQRRILIQPKVSMNRLGILFSGGVDCTILALLANKILPIDSEINLFNVAFEKNQSYNTPDRDTGLKSFNELKELCPKRAWNFIEINVTRETLEQTLNDRIKHLIHPLNTILDESLGSALWFASSYKIENLRVILVGMGADELFGGYSKHRNAFKNGGYLELENVLNNDWYNLPSRNLARDDRCISDHGRQVRTPYLDEDFVDYIRSLKCWEKCYAYNNLPAGVCDKLLLRLYAFYLGLKHAAFFNKRAIQFGSRIANSKENGNDISLRLTS